MKNIGFALIAAFALSAGQAMAVPFTETTDAGSLPTSIPGPVDAGTNVTSITGSTGGTIPGTNDTDYQDLFSFYWDGGLFEAATNGLFGSSRDFDTMLFLFNNDGTFITGNDDSFSPLDTYDPGTGPDYYGSYISEDLAAGDYLLGISGFSDFPEGEADSGAFWVPFSEVPGPGTGVLTSWEGNGATGNYVIGINQIPEPAPLALLALGLTALGLARRKRR